jgi:hypothetical protein
MDFLAFPEFEAKKTPAGNERANEIKDSKPPTIAEILGRAGARTAEMSPGTKPRSTEEIGQTAAGWIATFRTEWVMAFAR